MKGEVWTTHTTIIFIYGGLFELREKFTSKFGHHTIFCETWRTFMEPPRALLIFGNSWHHQTLNDFIEELDN
jgi:hypothetical protein